MELKDALKIADAFYRYLSSGNKGLINSYPKVELRAALNIIPHSDSRHQWYKEIERRIEEIEQKEREETTRKEKHKEKWFDRGIGFISGILVGLILAYLKGCLKGGYR